LRSVPGGAAVRDENRGDTTTALLTESSGCEIERKKYKMGENSDNDKCRENVSVVERKEKM